MADKDKEKDKDKDKAKDKPTKAGAAESRRSAEESAFEPYDFRNVEKPCSYFQSMANMVKGILGTGILAMPMAYKEAGLVNGFFLGILCAMFIVYCLHLLVEVQYHLCKQMEVGYLSFRDSTVAAINVGPLGMRKNCLRKAMPIIVDIFLSALHLGTMTAYHVFVALNYQSVFNYYLDVNISTSMYVIMCFPVFMGLTLISSLKVMSYFSWFANIVSVSCYGLACFYIFGNWPPFNDENPVVWFGWANIPLFIGTLLFALLPFGVIMQIEAEMKHPRQFVSMFGIVNVSYPIVSSFYFAFGICGYWRYADQIEPVITLNFERTEILANFIRAIYSVAIFISFSLHAYVPVVVLWNRHLLMRLTPNHQYIGTLCYKFVQNALTALLGLYFPFVDLLISLSGSLSATVLVFVIPGFMSICVNYPDHYGICKWRLLKDIIVVFLGFVAFLAGSYTGIYGMIAKRAN